MRLDLVSFGRWLFLHALSLAERGGHDSRSASPLS
jgi:hypothetical protein